MTVLPRISVIIPCYNREKYIREAIDSALAQPYVNKEIIVVDDGSTDGSARIIASYGDHITAIFTKNNGVSAARNGGLSLATGEYVTFLDSDDKLEPRCFERFLSAPFRPNRVFAGRARTLDSCGNATGLASYEFSELPSNGSFPLLQIVAELTRNCGCLIPTRLLLKIGGYDEKLSLGEDYDVNLRLLDAGAEFYSLSTYVYQARVHQDGRLTTSWNGECLERGADLYQRAWTRWKEQFSLPANRKWKLRFARRIWAAGRMAYRANLRECGNRLTQIAFEIGGRRAWEGSLAMKALYSVLSPYEAELVMERLKSKMIEQQTR